MLKWGRRYRIVFEIGERRDFTTYIPQETIEVTYPFTMRMNITNSTNMSSVSSASIQIYNLSRAVQAKLWKDNFNQTKYVTMWVYAGYKSAQLPLIFVGDVLECYSYREEGGTEWITDIKSSDGSYLFQYGISNYTFAKGTKFGNLLAILLQDNPTYKVGYITPSIQDLPQDRTFIGQTMDLLGREYGGYEIFIDKREINILDENDVVPSDIQVITAESGLLGSPRRAERYLECTTIFEPGLKIGQAVQLVSDSLPFVNNIYKVVGITHNGVISPVQSGKLTTRLQFYLGTDVFNELKKETNEYQGTTSGAWSKPVNGRITSNFGYRYHPIKKKYIGHEGIDIGANQGTPIYAPANGRVKTPYYYDGYGNYVSIDHGIINGKRVTSAYGHMQRWAVSAGQQVYKGQTVIGYVGSTGRYSDGRPSSTGPHLHFEIRENGNPVDPQKYVGAY